MRKSTEFTITKVWIFSVEFLELRVAHFTVYDFSLVGGVAGITPFGHRNNHNHSDNEQPV